ncbi:MAG: hypothetical protein LQ340_007993, partial [Diploschistes diacapsis]
MLQQSLRFSQSLTSGAQYRIPRISRFATRALYRTRQSGNFVHTSSRLFSAAAPNNAEAAQSSEPPPSTSTPPTADAAEDPMKKRVEAQDREIIDLKDKYLRSVADFRNLQERTKRDIGSARDFAISKFAKDLIDSVDNLDRALTTVPADALVASDENASSVDGEQGPVVAPNKDLVSLHSGLKMTEQIMMQTLAKHGLERYDPAEKEERFDPNRHEASFMAPMQGKEDGVVFTTIQKGFILNGRVIR